MNETQTVTVASLLEGLDPAQLQAVQFPPDTPLQVLAGPGSGKTRVLTHRIAYMILHHSIPPSSICAVAFTNKAVKEMRERLTKLIGPERTQQLKMGTFHALCAEFLRDYGTTNFSICDADESLRILAPIVDKHKEYLKKIGIPTDVKTIQSIISRAKARGITPDQIRLIYEKYQSELQRYQSLDFDDLLLNGIELFTHSEAAVSWCQYVLIDEFQDTNTAQYSLMSALARHKRVTVVGDPDQSIYAWRTADVRNMAKMHTDFDGIQQICLNHNYRSTTSILNVSSAILAQDQTRKLVLFNSSHPAGPKPFLCSFATRHTENKFIATEIKRLLAHMGGALSWGDIAILTRWNHLSSIIGNILNKNGIPYRVIGHKFLKEKAVKDILAYLQLVNNPEFNPAFVRACNVPKRGVGDKTLYEIASRARKSGNVSQLSIVEGICDGTLPDLEHSVKQKLSSFVTVIRTLRDLANQNTRPADLIVRLIDLIGFKEHLKKIKSDCERKWKSVEDLISFADEQTSASIDDPTNPLRSFLQTVLLASQGDNENEDKVAISTCHSAKGLEWPVVMIPTVEIDTFPSHFSEDVEEERRLFYVACTRAKGLLYLTYTENSKNGNDHITNMSPFISAAQREDPTLFTDQKPAFSPEDRQVICDVIGRPLPTEAEVAARVAEFVADAANRQEKSES